MMLELKAAADIKDNEGTAPLHKAAQEGHADVVRALLGRGATVDTCDRTGASPLW